MIQVKTRWKGTEGSQDGTERFRRVSKTGVSVPLEFGVCHSPGV